MRMKLIGACVAAMSICLPVAQAQQVTIEQFTQITGDLFALGTICPDLDGEERVVQAYMQANGITHEMISDKTGYISDVFRAEKASFVRRKFMSVKDNCADALRLYGDNGVVIKGLLFKKSSFAVK